MGRRNDSDDEGVSLFPFMSILACLIGILTLMISVVSAVKEMDRDKLTQEEYDRAVAHRDMRLEIEKLRQQAQQLDKRIRQLEMGANPYTWFTMDTLRDTWRSLQKVRVCFML